ncbi:sporulation protein YunB [Caproicibacterium lactatifermentans]|jgi:sporulation protein YunB|uniref:Sporulation protein YunB n=2 Tax=Caproicibacterium lactatifermentans TaxID=2666138 RepID=A0A859DSS1_9FIRM|nr:sporulation protein YunB [Caproicibacterium lactatifermentans]
MQACKKELRFLFARLFFLPEPFFLFLLILTAENYGKGGIEMHRFHCGRPAAWGILLLVAVMVIAVVGFDIAVRPYAAAVVACEAKNYAVKAVQAAVQKELGGKNVDHGSYVQIVRNTDGSIQSISSDVQKQNALQVELTQAVQNLVSSQPQETVGVPLGTLTGSSFLHGTGPVIPVHVTLCSTVQSHIVSAFDSTGINQTRHRLTLRVEVNMYTYFAGKDANQRAEVDIPVAETVIVGTVPGVVLQPSGKNS